VTLESDQSIYIRYNAEMLAEAQRTQFFQVNYKGKPVRINREKLEL